MSRPEVPLNGHCERSFERVKDAFANHLADGRQYGAAVAVFMRGEPVVDLWGGFQDAQRTKLWNEDTLVCMFSTAKSVGVLCVLMLVDRGEIALDEPVATYWPEFAQAGKEGVTVRHVLAHNSGVVFLDKVRPGSLFDYASIIKAIEAQAPTWKPGTQHAYHTFTIGYLVRELVGRVTGRKVADFWLTEVAEPLGLDFYLALSAEEQGRCATVYADADDAFVTTMRDHNTPIGRAWSALPSQFDAEVLFNSTEFREWGVPNAGHGNPRSLARLYGALAHGCKLDGRQLISPDLMEEAIRCHWDGLDAVLNVPSRHGLGFLLTSETFPFNKNPRAFFGVGAGGACAFGDPDAKLSFSYGANRMGPHLGGAEPLVEELIALTVAG